MVAVALAAAGGAFAATFGAQYIRDMHSASIVNPEQGTFVPAPGCNVVGVQVHGEIVATRADIPLTDIQPIALSDGSTYLSAPNYAIADEVADTLRLAAADDSIKGLIVDVESPGGGVVSGQEIAAAVRRFGKPSISVIHELGASSGYLVASAASRVYAAADSSVGSIGVTASYLSQVEKDRKDGYAYQQLSIGTYKDMGSPDKPLTDAERGLIMRDLATTREHFVDLVAQYRGLDRAEVDALADGSTMLGASALDNKLIDRIGGYDDALSDLEDQIGEPVSVCWQ